ncbi:MAG: hypothetical protein Q7T11_01835, partial [Deltaproteobacteria bacterium]|nr:hypothetical protein [Deltaproteobacteria bacterium]
ENFSKFWGGETQADLLVQAVRAIYFRGKEVSPELELVLHLAVMRWDRLVNQANHDLFAEKFGGEHRFQVTEIRDPKQEVITLFHVGNGPHTGYYSGRLEEGINFGGALSTDMPVTVWAVDIPMEHLEVLMGGPEGNFESVLMSPANPETMWPEAYGLRQIGVVEGKPGERKLRFEDSLEGNATLYGLMPAEMRENYERIAEAARTQGSIPADNQRHAVIPEGTVWDLSPDAKPTEEYFYGRMRYPAFDEFLQRVGTAPATNPSTPTAAATVSVMPETPALYRANHCERNVLDLIRDQLTPEQRGKARALVIGPADAKTRRDFYYASHEIVGQRTITGRTAWGYHVVLELDGHIYDYDYAGKPGVSLAVYAREMFPEGKIQVVPVPAQEYLAKGDLDRIGEHFYFDQNHLRQDLQAYVDSRKELTAVPKAGPALPDRAGQYQKWGATLEAHFTPDTFVHEFQSGSDFVEENYLTVVLYWAQRMSRNWQGVQNANLTLTLPSGVEVNKADLEEKLKEKLVSLGITGKIEITIKEEQPPPRVPGTGILQVTSDAEKYKDDVIDMENNGKTGTVAVDGTDDTSDYVNEVTTVEKGYKIVSEASTTESPRSAGGKLHPGDKPKSQGQVQSYLITIRKGDFRMIQQVVSGLDLRQMTRLHQLIGKEMDAGKDPVDLILDTANLACEIDPAARVTDWMPPKEKPTTPPLGPVVKGETEVDYTPPDDRSDAGEAKPVKNQELTPRAPPGPSVPTTGILPSLVAGGLSYLGANAAHAQTALQTAADYQLPLAIAAVAAGGLALVAWAALKLKKSSPTVSLPEFRLAGKLEKYLENEMEENGPLFKPLTEKEAKRLHKQAHEIAREVSSRFEPLTVAQVHKIGFASHDELTLHVMKNIISASRIGKHRKLQGIPNYLTPEAIRHIFQNPDFYLPEPGSPPDKLGVRWYPEVHYTHGTGSAALPGLVREGAIIPLGEMLAKPGPSFVFAGEKRDLDWVGRRRHANTELISFMPATTDEKRPKRLELFAEGEADLKYAYRLGGFSPEKAAQQAGEIRSGEMRLSRAEQEAQLNHMARQLEGWGELSALEKEMVAEGFPIIVRFQSTEGDPDMHRISSGFSVEMGHKGKMELNSGRLSFFVPSQKIADVKKYLADHGYDQVTVIPLEALEASRLIFSRTEDEMKSGDNRFMSPNSGVFSDFDPDRPSWTPRPPSKIRSEPKPAAKPRRDTPAEPVKPGVDHAAYMSQARRHQAALEQFVERTFRKGREAWIGGHVSEEVFLRFKEEMEAEKYYADRVEQALLGDWPSQLDSSRDSIASLPFSPEIRRQLEEAASEGVEILGPDDSFSGRVDFKEYTDTTVDHALRTARYWGVFDPSGARPRILIGRKATEGTVLEELLHYRLFRENPAYFLTHSMAETTDERLLENELHKA